MKVRARRTFAPKGPVAFVLCLAAGLAGVAMVACVGRPTVNVTDTFSQQEIDVPLGHELVVQLSANHESGYVWQLRDSIPGILRPAAEPRYIKDLSQTLRARDGSVIPLTMDGGGVEIWRFESLRLGTGRLRFEYRRPLAQEMHAERVVSWIVHVVAPDASK